MSRRFSRHGSVHIYKVFTSYRCPHSGGVYVWKIIRYRGVHVSGVQIRRFKRLKSIRISGGFNVIAHDAIYFCSHLPQSPPAATSKRKHLTSEVQPGGNFLAGSLYLTSKRLTCHCAAL